jgi:hypothetical protein
VRKIPDESLADHYHLVEKASHMAVAAPGYVTIIVDCPGLLSPGVQV